MQYSGVVLSVEDIGVSRSFYEELFGLKLEHDYGINLSFTCGLSLQQNFAWLIGTAPEVVQKKTHNVEICFEEEGFDAFLERLSQFSDIDYLGKVREHGWGQRVVRFYDPDGHLIEVGESMQRVIRRFLDKGMTLQEVSVRMDVREEDLHKLLQN